MTEDAQTSPPRPLFELWAETIVVLLIGVAPALFGSITYSHYVPTPPPFDFQAADLIIRSLGLIALIGLLVWRSGEPPATFGLQRPRAMDLGTGLGVFIASYVLLYVAWYAITLTLGSGGAGQMAQADMRAFSIPRGAWAVALLVVMSLCNGFAEEIVLRAYLIPRFEQLFGSTLLALLLSTVLFASYHSYQGAGGMVSIAAIGLAYGAAFCLFRRFWPIGLAHALQDLVGFVALMAGS